MTPEVTSLVDRKEKQKEMELVWSCDCPCGCKNNEFHIHIDASIECTHCGKRTKDWMESIDG